MRQEESEDRSAVTKAESEVINTTMPTTTIKRALVDEVARLGVIPVM